MTYDIAQMSPLKRHWIARNSNIPRRFWGFGAENIVEDMGEFPAASTKWLKDVYAGKNILAMGGIGHTGVGLLFDGTPGLGKTTQAVTVATEFIRHLPEDPEECQKLLHYEASDYGMKARPIYFLTFVELMARKKAIFDADTDERRQLHREMEGFHGRAREDFLNVRVLVLDDLSKAYGSSFDVSSFDELLRSRYDKGLPTIVTTNKPQPQWENQYTEAMGSFSHEAFTRVKLYGSDLRSKKKLE
jgi:DNA replication protein DnaC